MKALSLKIVDVFALGQQRTNLCMETHLKRVGIVYNFNYVINVPNKNMWAPAAVELDASIVPVGVDRILLLLRLFEAVLFTPGDPAPTFLGGQKVVDRTDPNLAMENRKNWGIMGISFDPWKSEGGLVMSYTLCCVGQRFQPAEGNIIKINIHIL